MAMISTRSRRSPVGSGDHRDVGFASARSLILRMRVAARHDRLARELAENADPGSSPERALRASQLTSDRQRRQFARTLRRTISEAYYDRLIRPPVVIINRAAVREAEDEINAMIARLYSAAPVCVEGMAIIDRMINGPSPLYHHTERGALRRLVLAATAALDSAPPVQHEWADHA